MAQLVKRYDVLAGKPYKVGREERTKWVKCGTMAMFDNGGLVQEMDCLPTGDWWDGTFRLFEQRTGNAQPQQEEQQPYQAAAYQPQQQAAQPQQGDKDDLPF